MPKENFYDPSVIETETPGFAAGRAFSVGWGTEGEDHKYVVRIAGVESDKSGIERLIRTLRKASKGFNV